MRRHLGIRGKVLAVLALPVLVLAGASGAASATVQQDLTRAQQTRVVAESADRLGRLVDALQAERSASVRAVSADAVARARLADLRAATDLARGAATAQLDAWSAGSLGGRARSAVNALGSAADRLPAMRQAVDAGTAEPGTVARGYGDVVGAVVDLPTAVADGLSDRHTAAGLDAAGWLGGATEALSREQLAGAQLLDARPGSTPAETARRTAQLTGELAAADAQRLDALDRFRTVAAPAEVSALELAVAVPNGATPTVDALVARLRTSASGSVSGSASGSAADGRAAALWQRMTSVQATGLRGVAAQLSQATAEDAAQAVERARLRLELTLAGAVLLVGLSVLLALIQSRRITAPLRHLTAVATGLAGQLPALVERTQAGGSAPEPPPVTVRTRDEVGRLAEAFRDVHATTLAVAHQQVALRATVADMFVNVARRNQVLLSRLLAFIDRLERHERDPDALDNLFRLDHLTTRMRRNAESLLVLAGADSGRRLRSAMPLADVLRAAVSEVEHYERIRLTLAVDPPIVGHLALATAHLFAELIENATNFSDPGSKVLISSEPADDGVRVTIRDEGIGLPPDELAAVNARLADPGTVDAMSSQRLGFFVVGRLAARLDSKVQLRRGDGRGTLVTVELSRALFLPGSLTGGPEGEAAGPHAGPARSVPLRLTTVPAGAQAALPQSLPQACVPVAQDAADPPEPVAPEPVAPEPVAPEPVTSAEAGSAGHLLPYRPDTEADRQERPGDEGEPTRSWQALLHQGFPGAPRAPIADPLSPTGWLASDAWVDAPPERVRDDAAPDVVRGAGADHPPGGDRPGPAPSAALPWQPEEQPVRARVADDATARLPRRTPPLPPIPGADPSAVLPRRQRPTRSLPGSQGLPAGLDVGAPVRSSGQGTQARTGEPSPADASPAPAVGGEPQNATVPAVPGVSRSALRDVLPRQGFRLSLRRGRRSRGRIAADQGGPRPAGSGAVTQGQGASGPTVQGTAGHGVARGGPGSSAGPSPSTPTFGPAAGPGTVPWAGPAAPSVGATFGTPAGAPPIVGPAAGATRDGPGPNSTGLDGTGWNGPGPNGPGLDGAGPGGTVGDQPAGGGFDGTGFPSEAPSTGRLTERPWVGTAGAGVPGADPVDEERLRHAIASEALSELSRLSTYRPDRVSSAPATRLVHRTPAAAPSPAAFDPTMPSPAAGELPTAGAPSPAPGTGGDLDAAVTIASPRDAEQLRRMLSGFQAGVRRGRTAPDPAPTPPTAAGPSGDAPTPDPGTDEWRTTP